MFNSQFQNEDDVGVGLVDLVEVDDVDVLHLGQYVNLLLDVDPGHASPGRLQPLLLDELGRILGPRGLLNDAMNDGELAAKNAEKNNAKMREKLLT